MANPVIRMMAFYLNNKKAATVNQVGYKINPARAAAFGQEGYLSHAKGAITTEFTINEVTPVAGSSFTALLQKVLAQEDIDCSVIVGGKLHKVKMAVTSVDFSSASETGMSNGTMTLQGGVPDVQF